MIQFTKQARHGLLAGAVRRILATSALTTALWMLGSTAALAGPVWRIDALSNSTAAPGSHVMYLTKVTNLGDATTDGSAIVLSARLPAGLTASDAVLTIPDFDHFVDVPCTAGDGSSPVAGAQTVRCETTWVVPPFGGSVNYLYLRLDALAGAGSGTLTSEFGVAGGGAAAASTVDPVVVTGSEPDFGFAALDSQMTTGQGDPVTQAGGAPDAQTVAIDLTTHTDPIQGPIWPIDAAKDIRIDLPPGLVGNPTAADTCTTAQLNNAIGIDSQPLCPATSQVGTALLRANAGSVNPGFTSWFGPVPVFNMVPGPGVPARFGFSLLGSTVTFDASVRSGDDYGVTVTSHNIPTGLVFIGATFTLWGVPAAATHDGDRACPGQSAPYRGGGTCTSGAPLKAFLRNPTACPTPGEGLPFLGFADSWFDPGTFASIAIASHLGPGYPYAPADWGPETGTTGCTRVPFDPTLDGVPASPKAASPSGFTFDLSLPQTSDPDVIAEADLKRATVTLPEGVRVSPSSADGLQACSPDQIRLHDGSVPDCPDAAKVGSVTVDTPLLDEPLTGDVFLASPHANPFGTLLSLYIVAEGSGVVVKQAGRVVANPVTGELSTTFDDIPQTPFSNLHLRLDGGSHAPLALPRQCGDYTTHAELESWSGKIVDTTSTFTVSGDGAGGPCPSARFSPTFVAQTEQPVAGKTTEMTVALARDDIDEELRAITVDLPDGLTGKIANVPLCSELDAKAATCPEASRIGSVTTGAGAGPNPFYIRNGRVYLTGPYKGAPFGIAIVVPAVAGPFDLGNVSVRSALYVDKHDATVRIVSDQLPTILEGIPLDVRDVRVSVDRGNFIVNPTSCAEKRIDGSIESTGGKTAAVSSRFQVGECRGLGFRPRMVLTVGGRGHTGRNATSPLSTRLTMPSTKQADLRSVRVTLPTTINARLTVINDACTRAEFEASLSNCDHARAGTATAITPLLRDPLSGNVYFVKNGHPIPDLFIALRGQVDFDLIGRVSIPGGKHLATTFEGVPDVPVRSFTLRLVGDRANGSVGAATNLCSRRGRTAKAELDYVAQNGRVLHVEQAPTVKGCERRKARKSGHHRRHHGRRGGR